MRCRIGTESEAVFFRFATKVIKDHSGLEVDFILAGGEVALEVKGSSRIDNADMRGLRSFVDQYKPKKAIIVCNERQARLAGDIRIVPWKDFLSLLWQGKII